MLYDPKWEVGTPVEVKPLAPWQQVLLNAADIMEHVGYCVGSLEDKQRHVCALGAINAATSRGCALTPHGEENTEAVKRLAAAVDAMPYYSGINNSIWCHVASWSNAQGDGAPVVAKMREVALAG